MFAIAGQSTVLYCQSLGLVEGIQNLRDWCFHFLKLLLRGNDREFMASAIPEEHLNQQLISKQFPRCSSTQLLWEVMLTANLLNTFGSRWATSHTLFDEHAFLQSGKTICRRMLSFCILLVFEMSPSSASLPQTLALRMFLTAIRRQLKVNRSVAATTLWQELWSWLGESLVNESQLPVF